MREGLGVVVGLALVGVVLWHRSEKTLAADAQELHAFSNPEALLRILDEATPELLLEQRGALGERVAQQRNDKLERNLRGREILQGQEAGGGLLDSNTETVESGIANNFGMIGIWGNSNTFGSSNSAGDPDNGITFSNVTVELIPVPEPSGVSLLLLGGMLVLRRRRKA